MTRLAAASRLALLLTTTMLVLAPAAPAPAAPGPAGGVPPESARPEAAPPASAPVPPSPQSPAERIAEEAAAKLPYDVEFTGIEDGDLRTLLRDTSTLVSLKKDPPPSVLGLERRADDDRERLLTALHSAGYYDATLGIAVDAKASPAKVTVSVTPGPAYHFKTIDILPVAGATVPGDPISAGDLGLKPGDRARAPEVVSAGTLLLGRMAQRGHPFATIAERRVVVDHGDQTMDVTYTLDPGPLVTFGPTTIKGLSDVDEDLVRGRLPWKVGQVYDPKLIEQARGQIAQLQVFDTVRVNLAAEPGPGGVTPVTVSLTEKLPRFVGASTYYSSTDGFGGGAYWGHRNLFGGAERLRLGVDIGRIASTSGSSHRDSINLPDLRLSANFQKPDFLAPRQTLILDFQVASEQPPAYDRVATEISGRLERPLTDQIKLSYGISSERARVRSNEREYQTALVGLPVGIAWDGSNSLLNPTKGYRASFQATPWFPAGADSDTQFSTLQINGSAYQDLAGDGNYVLAERVGLGATLGATLGQIPPDHRFYAGGGGSVRGFGFQKAGPRDVYGDPTGGRSLFEAGLELRVKVTDSIGVVPFVDAGTVYDSAYPNFSQPLKAGAGLGLRYYTGFGPLRVDVGFPINKEPGDAIWQLYISLGQAF